MLNTVERLLGGVKKNAKGFKVLPDHIRVLQGDGIDEVVLKEVLEAMKENGWASNNVAFGSGGGVLQQMNRDTLKCAYKASYVEINGEGKGIYKEPKTDPGFYDFLFNFFLRNLNASARSSQIKYFTPLFFWANFFVFII